MRAEKTEPEKQDQLFRAATCCITADGTETRTTEPPLGPAVGTIRALGGPSGGGFAAPPVQTNVPGDDGTAPFRERVGACSKQPEGVEPSDKVIIKIRVSFELRRHRGVSAALARLDPISETAGAPGWKVQPMPWKGAEPFTMPPPEKYKQWKTMVVYVTPLLVYRCVSASLLSAWR